MKDKVKNVTEKGNYKDMTEKNKKDGAGWYILVNAGIMLSGNEAETAWTSPQKPASIMGQPPYIIIFYYLEIYSTPPPSSSSYIFTISIVCLLNYLLYA